METAVPDSAESRSYTPLQRAYMGSIDAGLAIVGGVLRVGGKPLKRVLCAVLGTTAWALMPGKRRVAHANLELVYGSEMNAVERRRIVQGMFKHFVRLGLDFIFDTVYWPPGVGLESAVRVEGIDRLEAAFRKGRGVLCVSGHLGNWEIMCAAAAAHGFDFYGVYKRPKHVWTDRFMRRKRLRYGMNLLEAPGREGAFEGTDAAPAPRRSLRADVERLWRSGHAVAYLCDQRPKGGGLPMRFLGVEGAATAAGLIRYAVAHHVPLTMHRCVYEADGHLRWTIEGPVDIVDQPGGAEATTAHYVQLVNDWISQSIRLYPEQWTWGHRRFERRFYAPHS